MPTLCMVYHHFPFGHLGSFVFDPHKCPIFQFQNLKKMFQWFQMGPTKFENFEKIKKWKGRPRLDPISPLFWTFIEAFEPLREPKPWRFREELRALSNGKKTHHSPPPLAFFPLFTLSSFSFSFIPYHLPQPCIDCLSMMTLTMPCFTL